MHMLYYTALYNILYKCYIMRHYTISYTNVILCCIIQYFIQMLYYVIVTFYWLPHLAN